MAGAVLRKVTGTMRQALRIKIIDICNKKIQTKGDSVGVSFYAFLPIKMMTQNSLWTLQLGGFKPIGLIILRKP